MYLLRKIKVDPNSFVSSSLFIQGFGNNGKTAMGTIILYLKVGTVTISTLVHMMPSPLSYNLLFDRLWLHDFGSLSSILHVFRNFVANNQFVTIKADREAMRLCQIVIVGQASVAPSFQNYVLTLSSLVMNYTFVSSPKKEEQKKEEVPRKKNLWRRNHLGSRIL